MNYYETSNRSIPHRSWFFRQNKCAIERQVEPSMTFLKAIFTPETTTPPIVAGAQENLWFGAVKTLFWITNAIIIGITVAKVCC